MAKKILIPLACLVALVAPPGAHAKAREPIRVLSFSGQFPGSLYYHEESISRSKREFARWGPEFDFDFVDCGVDQCTDKEFAALKKSNLDKYDVLVLFNASGNYPPAYRDDLISWLRQGHGLFSVSSTADGQYEWAEFSDLMGGRAEDHYILAPSNPKDPPAMVAVNEDPKNPLVKHLGPTLTFSDETYKWKIDPRPDVHVLLGFDNLSQPQGLLFQLRMPLVWCKEAIGARLFHMAYGHSGFIFDDAGLVRMMKQALRWEARRLGGVDCSVPSMHRRLGAVWADMRVGGHSAVSSESGALAVVTDFPTGGKIGWNRVNLTGVRSLEIRATGHSEQAMPGFPFPQPPPQAAAGGIIQVRLDKPTGRLLGSVEVQANPRWDQTNPMVNNTAPQPGWASYTITLSKPIKGRHSLWLVGGNAGAFGAVSPADAAGSTKYGVIGAIAWVKLR